MAEQADAADLKSAGENREGSIPSPGTMIKLTRENAQEEVKGHDILVPPSGDFSLHIYEVTGINSHGPFIKEYPNNPKDGKGNSHLLFDNLGGWYRIPWIEFVNLATNPYIRKNKAMAMRKEVSNA